MAKHTSKSNEGRSVKLLVFGFVGLVLLVAMLLYGTDIALFNPKGLIAEQQLRLMLLVGGALVAAAVPTLTLLYFFAWKYRESNDKATYNPDLKHSKLFIVGLWALPTALMLVLATIMWIETHRLEPQKLIVANTNSLKVQVIALRWKWLFIYPDQRIATVNFLQVPTGTPLEFELTADEAPMSSFWIPHLGGQLYAMTGHVNRLNLLAETAGDYTGSSAEINGAGFAGMKFTARASTPEAFDLWVRDVRASSHVLDADEYTALLKPSESQPAAYYSQADASLYDTVLMKYNGSHHHHTEHE